MTWIKIKNSVSKFADDRKLFGVIENDVQHQVHQQLQNDLSALVDWSKQ